MSEKNKIKVKVGVVGVGMVSYSHIDAYQAHPNAEVVAVCDKDEERVKQVAQIYGIKKYYTDYAEMLKDPEINTVDIATPTFMHVEMTIQAAEAGKNIHCEKPFCLNLEEGERACEAAKKNGVFYYPILVRHEKDSWNEFTEKAVQKLLDGSYEGAYQQEKAVALLDNLK